MATTPTQTPFNHALMAGALAGTTVDLTLFPLDTLKTRLQSASGFFASGGFSGIYRGVGSAVVGSAPGAAFFFVTYETTKTYLSQSPQSSWISGAGTHMAAASLGEVAACAIRVPTEVVKQRAQAGQHGGRSGGSLRHILGLRKTLGVRGVWMELYRGWSITIFREVPFTVIQFPLWEALKAWGRERRERTGRGLFGDLRVGKKVEEVGAPESAVYGSLAGAVAAGVTTPLDVLKTRVMLSRERRGFGSLAREILKEHGFRPFFAGIGPRVMWISIGGAVFLGSYQWAVNALQGRREVKNTERRI
ncbi:mitochondrial carrier domain-containing protein [Coniochaeta sp. 2T2.1]|nr:mitochondrial carrier domain-containing protein [Coniochaeta sp. 2T2.1]